MSDDIGISAGTCRRELIGAILGGVVGGVIGNEVGDPGSKNVTTVAGAVLGVLIGKTARGLPGQPQNTYACFNVKIVEWRPARVGKIERFPFQFPQV